MTRKELLDKYKNGFNKATIQIKAESPIEFKSNDNSVGGRSSRERQSRKSSYEETKSTKGLKKNEIIITD